MVRYGLGSILQELHALRYPIKDVDEFIQQILSYGDVYIKDKLLTEIAENIDYPIYSGGDCVDKILDASKKTKHSTKIFSDEKTDREMPDKTTGIKTISVSGSSTPIIENIAEYTTKVKDIENRIKTLKDVKTQIPRIIDKETENEALELELKTALANLKLDQEEKLKNQMLIELKKLELEAQSREKERDLTNRMELELKKKLLEMEMKEKERELQNRMQIELKRKEMEIELKKKELELITKERDIENEIKARVQIALKEKELEIRKLAEEEAERKIAKRKQELDEEYKRKEELLERRVRLEQRDAAAKR